MAEARRACVFPLHDPERKPAYSLPNDRVLRWAGESDDRVVRFCRLDRAEGAVAEADRCLANGARGIKLHPRAQDFVFDGGDLDDVFGLAEEAGVPVLIHAGRGLPPLADGLADLALRHPGAALILAHGAICDQGILSTRLAGHPLFTGVAEQAAAMLEMAIAATRDPEPGEDGEALETVGRALRAAAKLAVEEDGIRPAIDLVYRANVLAATQIADTA